MADEMDEWERLPDGGVAVALFAGWGVALAPPTAAAVRIIYVEDEAAARDNRTKALQVAMTPQQLRDLGQAMLDAAASLEQAEG